MMRKCRRVLFSLLVLILLLTEMLPMTGMAVDRDYMIRFSAGNSGTIVGTAEYKGNGNATIPNVTPNAGYYLKGFKESGKDPTSFLSPGGVIPADRDQDFVAVYGISGTEVQYQVQYLLYGTTTKLASDGFFFAGVGDRPVSSYIYIEGYVPYLRTTKTIVADESQNVLYAYYTATPTETTTTTAAAGAAVAGAGAAVAGGNAAGGAANAAAAGANAANPVQANPAAPANPGVAVAGANAVNPNAAAPAQQQYAQTEDILDLDVPLAAPEGSAAPVAPAAPAVSAPPVVQPQDSNKTGLPTWALVGGGAVGVGLIALLYWYLLFYRKKKKYADIDDLFDGK